MQSSLLRKLLLQSCSISYLITSHKQGLKPQGFPLQFQGVQSYSFVFFYTTKILKTKTAFHKPESRFITIFLYLSADKLLVLIIVIDIVRSFFKVRTIYFCTYTFLNDIPVSVINLILCFESASVRIKLDNGLNFLWREFDFWNR